MKCRTPSISTSGSKTNMKISVIKYFPAWITSTQDSSGGSGCFPKEGQERRWREDGEGMERGCFCAVSPGLQCMGALFPVTMTPPGDARAQPVPAMPLGILIITQDTHCSNTSLVNSWLMTPKMSQNTAGEGRFWYQHYHCPHLPSLPPTLVSASTSKKSLWNDATHK